MIFGFGAVFFFFLGGGFCVLGSSFLLVLDGQLGIVFGYLLLLCGWKAFED